MIGDQLGLLRQTLLRCKETIDNPAVDPKLRDRVRPRFDKQLTQLEARHEALVAKVGRGPPLEPCWRELAKLQRDSDDVFRECLDFIHGALARKAALDHDICSVTDDLLDDLATDSDVNWGRFTVLATSEFYRDAAEIVRIRYPEMSLWGIPLAAHEFGHYVGPQLKTADGGQYAYPFQEKLKTADENRSNQAHTQDWHHLQEHFADLFATYALGPAYAAALIVLRLNPAEAQEDTLSHPSGAKRVRGILRVLNKMHDLEATGLEKPFKVATDSLRTAWQKSLNDIGLNEVTGAAASLTDQRIDALFELLKSNAPPRLMCRRADWSRAQRMADQWIEGRNPLIVPEASRRDVLNGAWLARLLTSDQSPWNLSRIARESVALLRERRSPAAPAAQRGR